MAVKDRKAAIAAGQKLYNEIQGQLGRALDTFSILDTETIKSLIEDLGAHAQEVYDDYLEAYDNLSERSGLQEHWEESNGEARDAWEECADELSRFAYTDAGDEPLLSDHTGDLGAFFSDWNEWITGSVQEALQHWEDAVSLTR